jgi:hypothetical protein
MNFAMKTFQIDRGRPNHRVYDALDSDETTTGTNHRRRQMGFPCSLPQAIVLVLACTMSCSVGFILRQPYIIDTHPTNTPVQELSGSLKPPGDVIKTFEFQAIFSQPPSEESNAAWARYVPRKDPFENRPGCIFRWSILHRFSWTRIHVRTFPNLEHIRVFCLSSTALSSLFEPHITKITR